MLIICIKLLIKFHAILFDTLSRNMIHFGFKHVGKLSVDRKNIVHVLAECCEGTYRFLSYEHLQ